MKTKKFIKKIILSVAAFAACFGFALPVFAVSANSTETVIENSSVEVISNDDSVENEEVIEETNSTENSAILEGETNTFENFLAWTEQEAGRYGYEDEYAAALEAIKTAATTKQVTISTIGSFSIAVAFVAYIIYKRVADKVYKQKISELANTLSAQLGKINELVDGTNANTKTEEEIKLEEAALKEEMQRSKKALANLICGFMHFTDSVSMKDTKKAEVQRDCINALKEIDGEAVSANEDNQK